MKKLIMAAVFLAALRFSPLAQAAEPAGAKQVSYKTADGWTIVGDLYLPKGHSRGAVLLLHQRGGQASDWTPICYALQAEGMTALAIDQRGTHRSLKGPGPFGNDAPWPTGGDIAAGIRTLHKYGPVGLAGASYGANNILIYAAAHPKEEKAIALLSPGANYSGLDGLAAAPSCTVNTLILTYTGDPIAGKGPEQINALMPGKKHTLVNREGNGHGTAMMYDNTVVSRIVSFFKETLTARR